MAEVTQEQDNYAAAFGTPKCDNCPNEASVFLVPCGTAAAIKDLGPGGTVPFDKEKCQAWCDDCWDGKRR